MKDISKFTNSNKKYYIYGTAMLGKYCYQKMREVHGDDIVLAFVETNPDSRPFDGGKPIISLKEAAEQMDRDTHMIISGLASAEIMKQNCLEAGISESQIVLIPQEFADYLKIGFSYPLTSVCFWPPIQEEDAEVLQKIAFYIPDRIQANIFTEEDFITDKSGENVCCCDISEKEKLWEASDAILLWDVNRADGLFEKYSEKIRIVDSHYWEHLDTLNYVHLYHDSFALEELDALLNNSKKNFMELQTLAKQYKKGNIFCSGPSISEVYDMEPDAFADGFNIICNSMIKDRELMEMLQPKVLCFFDSNFFHSPGKYGEAFYKDLRETFQQYGYYVVVQELQCPLLLRHCPEMKEKIIGVPSKKENAYWFISLEKFAYRPLANILTDIMVPLASACFDEISIAGCTGRGEEKNYFWRHNERTQYLDLKEDVMKMWPAFFHYRKYDAYYDRHCQTLEEQLRYGESLGKNYVNITTSYIPALQKRNITRQGTQTEI